MRSAVKDLKDMVAKARGPSQVYNDEYNDDNNDLN
jgi:hypothetical protein